MDQLLAELGSLVIVFVGNHGYVGLAILMFLGGLFVPVPTQIVLPLVGFLVLRGELSFVVAAAVATAGSVGGALAVYALGYRLGEEMLRRFVGRFGRLLFLRESDLDRVLRYFELRGGMAVMVGRMVPGATSFVSVPAGLARMPVLKYLAYTTVGCAVWNTAHIALGWALGTQWRLVTQYAPTLQYTAISALAAAALWFLWRRRSRSSTSTPRLRSSPPTVAHRAVRARAGTSEPVLRAHVSQARAHKS